MIFVDTSFWYAYSSPDDDRHSDAVQILGEVAPETRLVTTDRVLEELWTLLRSRKSHARSVRTLAALRASRRLTRRPVTAELAASAWEWLARHDERIYSFVDAASFALMRREGLHEALAFDGDFQAAGFVEMRT